MLSWLFNYKRNDPPVISLPVRLSRLWHYPNIFFKSTHINKEALSPPGDSHFAEVEFSQSLCWVVLPDQYSMRYGLADTLVRQRPHLRVFYLAISKDTLNICYRPKADIRKISIFHVYSTYLMCHSTKSENHYYK